MDKLVGIGLKPMMCEPDELPAALLRVTEKRFYIPALAKVRVARKDFRPAGAKSAAAFLDTSLLALLAGQSEPSVSGLIPVAHFFLADALFQIEPARPAPMS